MKTIAVLLLAGAGALCMTAPAGAAGLHAKHTMLNRTASAQMDMSSRHRHYRVSHYRVSRVGVYPRGYRNSFALAPVGVGIASTPYVESYRTYEPYAWGPPGPFVGVGFGGYDSYAYEPGPYVGFGGYDPYYYGGPTISVGLAVKG